MSRDGLAPKEAAPERGLVVGARYRLESVLGEGGMAVVWAAVHTETDRRVALKLVKPEFVRDEQIREMFVREARVAARVGSSDYIVDVLDAGVDAALEVPFIVMELLEGQALDARLRNGPLPRAMVADLLEQLGEALDQAHSKGVYHRDLKPQNLYLTKDRKGQPLLKVLDFGIAKLSDAASQAATQVGTPAYSAPEQLGDSWRSIAKNRGQTIASKVTGAADVWALGLVAFEMLTAAPPGSFWGATTLAELPVKIVLEPLPSASKRADPALLPAGFDAWLARCLDLDATRRWPSARDAVQALIPALRAVARAPSAPSHHPHTVPQQQQAPRPISQPPHGPLPKPPGPPHGSPPGPPLGPPAGTAPPGGGRWAQPMPVGPAYPTPVGPPPMDPRLAQWAAHRGAELRVPGDGRPFLTWQVVYLPRIEHVARDARIPQQGALATIAEVITSDAIRKAMGEERMLVALVQSPRLRFRAAVRSKRSSGGVVDGVSRGLKALDALIAPQNVGILGDPQFEAQFEAWATSPQEAHAALPIPLRQTLVGVGFHGILERFPGALLVSVFDASQFNPQHLDRLLDVCARVLAAIPP
jgi:serine/threonine protein kinase